MTTLRAKLSSFLLRFLSDNLFIRYYYWRVMKRHLNLKNPTLFTEKIQWLKLHNRKKEYSIWVDKYESKRYVSSLIGHEHIIPTLDVWNKFDEINFDELPSKFVLKTTHDSGGVVICNDKSNFNIEKAKQIINKSLSNNFYYKFREWPYKYVKPRIIAEVFMQQSNNADLIDYKFYCFNGQPLYCQVIQNRSTNETIDFFDSEWNHQEFYGLTPIAKPANTPIAKPANLKKMLDIAKCLSFGQSFLRVDLYEINEQVYFGELTFSPNAGYGVFTPNEWNLKLGNLIDLNLCNQS